MTAADMERSKIAVEHRSVHRFAFERHFGDMALQRSPVVEAYLPRNQVLRLGKLRRRPEARKRFRLACVRGLEQLLGAFALLFEIETKLGIGSERVGHDRFPSRSPAFAQADKGNDRP